MMALNLPTIQPRLRRQRDKLYIYDNLRERFVRLTPEEWVRQHFVSYLTNYMGYPSQLMMNEVSLELNGMKKRADTILYNRELKACLLIEYKAPSVKLSQTAVDQIVRYNYVFRVPYLLLSNGLEHLAYHIDYEAMTTIPLLQVPSYEELIIRV